MNRLASYLFILLFVYGSVSVHMCHASTDSNSQKMSCHEEPEETPQEDLGVAYQESSFECPMCKARLCFVKVKLESPLSLNFSNKIQKSTPVESNDEIFKVHSSYHLPRSIRLGPLISFHWQATYSVFIL